MGIVIAALIVVVAAAAAFLVRRLSADEVFDGVTPGLLPTAGQPEVRRRRRRGEQPPIAVQFTPPKDLGPGLAGVAIDGRVDPVELSATMIDLAGRGWLSLRPLTTQPEAKPLDWEVQQAEPAPAEELSPTETLIYAALFTDGPLTTLAAFRTQRSAELAEAAEALEAEASDRSWFRELRQEAAWGVNTGGLAAVLLGFLAVTVANQFWIGAGLIAGGVVFFLATRGLPRPFSAEGSAARTQALGFREYLATAEAEQLRFEVGIDVFSRYLPYAMVFGVVDHWRSVFAQAITADPEAEFSGLEWLVLDNALTGLLLADLLTSDVGLFDGLSDDFAGFEADPVADFGTDWGDGGGFDGGFDGGGFGD